MMSQDGATITIALPALAQQIAVTSLDNVGLVQAKIKESVPTYVYCHMPGE